MPDKVFVRTGMDFATAVVVEYLPKPCRRFEQLFFDEDIDGDRGGSLVVLARRIAFGKKTACIRRDLGRKPAVPFDFSGYEIEYPLWSNAERTKLLSQEPSLKHLLTIMQP